MGMFINIAAKDLEEFTAWRRANDKSGDKIIILEPLSRKRTDTFKVWFDSPLAAEARRRWYDPANHPAPAEAAE